MLLLLSSEDLKFETFMVLFLAVRTILDMTFLFFIFSPQTPMCRTDENNNVGNLRMQNEIGNETLTAPLYKENLNQFYPLVHILSHPKPISSNLSEPVENESNVVHTLGNVPPKFIAGATSASSTFSVYRIKGNAPNTSNNGNSPNDNGNAPLAPTYKVFCNFTEEKLKEMEKGKNSKNKSK